jgi:hypothetical protein
MLHGEKIREREKKTNKLMVALLKKSFGGVEQKCLIGNFKLFALGQA